MLLAVIASIPALLIWGGPVVTDTVSWGAKKYLATLEHLRVSFDRFSGSPFEGYELTGLRAGDAKNQNIVAASRLFFAIDPEQSWKLKKLVFRAV